VGAGTFLLGPGTTGLAEIDGGGGGGWKTDGGGGFGSEWRVGDGGSSSVVYCMKGF